jgi:CheY-like chemotaxis protein
MVQFHRDFFGLEDLVPMPVRVLLADPDQILLTEYADFLKGVGFEVATAADALECLAMLRSFSPDVLVMEPRIPWGWGEGILAVLRDGSAGPRVPVILLTADGEYAEALERVRYPISACETKPLKPFSLANRILRILAK